MAMISLTGSAASPACGADGSAAGAEGVSDGLEPHPANEAKHKDKVNTIASTFFITETPFPYFCEIIFNFSILL